MPSALKTLVAETALGAVAAIATAMMVVALVPELEPASRWAITFSVPESSDHDVTVATGVQMG